jgi:short subunit dehydrogenase-like uncharacterized protein
MARRLDVLVWGATGFTGRLVAEYLLKKRPNVSPHLKWGIGGRSSAKLEALKKELGAPDLPVVIGDAMSREDMDRVASETRVVATTAGPFMQHGRELVGACARAGTHYCDLTGETTFVREAIDLHHETAIKSRARLVPCSGFDSIPSDLGVFLLHEALGELKDAKMFVVKSSGGISGGTVASMLLLMEQAQDRAVRRLLADPYALSPTRGPEHRDFFGAKYDQDLEAWVGPFIMAAINTRVVRRSSALLGYGKELRYDEMMRTGKGIKGQLRAYALAGGMGAGVGLLAFEPTRKLLAKTVLPKPGEGPSKEVRDKGHFTLRFVGTSTKGEKAWATVAGTSDPGYGETAKMLAETALLLADEAKLPERFGVLTPASAGGRALVERLRAAGMTLEVDAAPSRESAAHAHA